MFNATWLKNGWEIFKLLEKSKTKDKRVERANLATINISLFIWVSSNIPTKVSSVPVQHISKPQNHRSSKWALLSFTRGDRINHCLCIAAPIQTSPSWSRTTIPKALLPTPDILFHSPYFPSVLPQTEIQFGQRIFYFSIKRNTISCSTYN